MSGSWAMAACEAKLSGGPQLAGQVECWRPRPASVQRSEISLQWEGSKLRQRQVAEVLKPSGVRVEAHCNSCEVNCSAAAMGDASKLFACSVCSFSSPYTRFGRSLGAEESAKIV